MFKEQSCPEVWYNVPIIRTGHTNTKRVSWSDQLTEVKTISPRYESRPFSFHQARPCTHYSCTEGQSCALKGNSHVFQDPGLYNSLNCSPQMKKVVFQAVNKTPSGRRNWQPNRNNLSLKLGNNY